MLELPRQHVVSLASYENISVSASSLSLSLFVSQYYQYCSTSLEYSYTTNIERSVFCRWRRISPIIMEIIQDLVECRHIGIGSGRKTGRF